MSHCGTKQLSRFCVQQGSDQSEYLNGIAYYADAGIISLYFVQIWVHCFCALVAFVESFEFSSKRLVFHCRWLKHVKETIRKDELEATEAIAWAAYHAILQPEPVFIPSISAHLPLLTEQCKFVAMVQHSLDIVKKADEHLNPGQNPVDTSDQPLFKLAKQIQWCGQKITWGTIFYYAWGFAYRNGRFEMLRTLA